MVEDNNQPESPLEHEASSGGRENPIKGLSPDALREAIEGNRLTREVSEPMVKLVSGGTEARDRNAQLVLEHYRARYTYTILSEEKMPPKQH